MKDAMGHQADCDGEVVAVVFDEAEDGIHGPFVRDAVRACRPLLRTASDGLDVGFDSLWAMKRTQRAWVTNRGGRVDET